MTTTLTAVQRRQLVAALEARRQQLKSRLIEHHGGHSRVEHARDVLLQDGDDAPQRDSDREVDMVLSDLEAQELAAVALALTRAQHDDFGLCADCGAAIPFARLQLEPWALRCVSCESQREARSMRAHPATM